MTQTPQTLSPLTRPLARYAHARRVGALLFVAGQGARDPATDQEAGITTDATGRVIAHDLKVQTAAVLANVERALASHGLNRTHIVDVTVFLTDMAEFPLMNQIWNEFFADAPAPPTRTTVAVAALPGRNFVEMKAIAAFA